MNRNFRNEFPENFCSIRFWTGISGNFGRMERAPFFLEIWKFRKFPVPFGISTRYESAPATRWQRVFRDNTTLDAIIWHSSSLFLIAYSPQKRLGSDFLKNCGLVLLNFLWVSSPGLHTLPQVKFVSFSHQTWLGQSGKYQKRVEFWMCVKLLYVKQLRPRSHLRQIFEMSENVADNFVSELVRDN